MYFGWFFKAEIVFVTSANILTLNNSRGNIEFGLRIFSNKSDGGGVFCIVFGKAFRNFVTTFCFLMFHFFVTAAKNASLKMNL